MSSLRYHSSALYFLSIAVKTMHTATPATPITKKSIAAPEPLPSPKSAVRKPDVLPSIKGSKTLSVSRPPRSKPMGIVKN